MTELASRRKLGGLSPRLWLASLLTFAILVGLGTWQVRRLAWKNDLITTLAERQDEAPLPYRQARDRARKGDDVRFQPVEIEGVYWHSSQATIPTVRDGQRGWRIVTPLVISGSREVVLVERGLVFDREANAPPQTPSNSEPSPTVTVVAQVRPSSETNPLLKWTEPVPDLDRGVFYAFDRDAIAQRAGASELAPFDVTAIRETPQWAAPEGLERVRLDPSEISNRHLGYVITWYGLAVALLAVVIAYHLARRRRVRGVE